LGSGKVKENIEGFRVEVQKLFCKLVVDGGVLRICGKWEDVYMKRKSIYSISSWYKSDVLGLAHDNTVFAHKKYLWLFFDI
jgi:hypothetical protein